MGQPTLDEVSRKVDLLWRQSPLTRWQYVDVVFAANTNTDIVHTLLPQQPEDVRWLVVRSTAAIVPFHSPLVSCPPWTTSHIWLQAPVAGTARLLLFLERVNA